MLEKKLKKNAVEQGSLVIKVMSFQTITFLTVASQIFVFWLSAKEDFFPSIDVWRTIITTCSQIIAGLYGITMAGYTFFLSRIDGITASDFTLDYVVASIKNRFKGLIWYLTFNVLMTLFSSVILMYCPAPEGKEIGFVYRLFCNEFLVFVCFSIGLILYYSVLVVNPNCIEKEAGKLKKRLCRGTGTGNITEFISLYDQIEKRCNEMLPKNVLQQVYDNKGKKFEYTIELLYEIHPKLRPLIPELTRIHRYYECMINCTPMSVSHDMCTSAKRVLAFMIDTRNIL